MLRVFLSSTAKDLSECRDIVYQAIEGLEGYHCVRMEDFGAWDQTPSELCRRRVVECDLFVLLAGPLYGSLGPLGVSYTEAEYESAQQAGKPCLVFLTEREFLIPASIAESSTLRRKQEAFRRKVSDRVRATFANCHEAAVKVVQAIRNWELSPAEHSIIRIWRSQSLAIQPKEFRRPFLRFGRNPEAEVPIVDDPDVSWEHGMIFKHAGQFYYRHLSSTNPSRVSTETRQILLIPGRQQEVALGYQNHIQLGRTTLSIEIALGTLTEKLVPTNKQDGHE